MKRNYTCGAHAPVSSLCSVRLFVLCDDGRRRCVASEGLRKEKKRKGETEGRKETRSIITTCSAAAAKEEEEEEEEALSRQSEQTVVTALRTDGGEERT